MLAEGKSSVVGSNVSGGRPNAKENEKIKKLT
jgi:hypothetical protein